MTRLDALALIVGALLGCLTIGWLIGRWHPARDLAERLRDEGWDEHVATQTGRVLYQGPYREVLGPDTTGDIPVISSELLPPEWPSPRALDPPADWLDGPGEMTDEQWADELHQMNTDLPAPDATGYERGDAAGLGGGELHWPAIVAAMDPLTRLKLEGWGLRQRQQARLAAWEDACRKSWDVQVAA